MVLVDLFFLSRVIPQASVFSCKLLIFAVVKLTMYSIVAMYENY